MKFGYKAKLELYVAACIFLIGIFFLYQASKIGPALHDVVGPRALPLTLAVLLLVGSLSILARALLGYEGKIQEEYGFQTSDIKRIFAVIASGAVYVVTFWAFGYFVSTCVAVGLIAVSFGHRKIWKILLFSLFAGIVYQFIFMGMMGLYDPAGKVIDFRDYTNWIIGVQ